MATKKEYTQEELCKALKYHFSYDKFRPFQLDAIHATLAGRDSLLILPTGLSRTHVLIGWAGCCLTWR
jgi:Lhr-like helicase